MPDLLGAHMSIAGGVYRALERGLEVGCSVVQIFLKNQLQWAAAPYSTEDIRRFRDAWKATRMRAVFAHSSYLINLAAPAEAEWKRAVAAFQDELERAEALGLPFVIIHPGSHRGEGLDKGISRIVAALDEVFARTRGYRVMVLLENTAGGGATIGRTFEELALLLRAVKVPERVGVCLDTCRRLRSEKARRLRRRHAELCPPRGDPARPRLPSQRRQGAPRLRARSPRKDRQGQAGRGRLPPAHDRRPLPACAHGPRDAEGARAPGGPGGPRPIAQASR
jgi:Xylose isomerase-like TIM barrel